MVRGVRVWPGGFAARRTEVGVRRSTAWRSPARIERHPDRYSCFSNSSVMVPMVNCMRTRICTGSRRWSSVSQT